MVGYPSRAAIGSHLPCSHGEGAAHGVGQGKILRVNDNSVEEVAVGAAKTQLVEGIVRAELQLRVMPVAFQRTAGGQARSDLE